MLRNRNGTIEIVEYEPEPADQPVKVNACQILSPQKMQEKVDDGLKGSLLSIHVPKTEKFSDEHKSEIMAAASNLIRSAPLFDYERHVNVRLKTMLDDYYPGPYHLSCKLSSSYMRSPKKFMPSSIKMVWCEASLKDMDFDDTESYYANARDSVVVGDLLDTWALNLRKDFKQELEIYADMLKSWRKGAKLSESQSRVSDDQRADQHYKLRGMLAKKIKGDHDAEISEGCAKSMVDLICAIFGVSAMLGHDYDVV